MSDDEDAPGSPAADDLSYGPLSVIGLARKLVSLAERTAQLRRRNQMVVAKVQETKRRQQALEAISSAQMLLLMTKASERRLRHLELVREKARILRLFLDKRYLETTETEALALWPAAEEELDSSVSEPEFRVIARAVRRYRLRKAFKSRQCRLYFDKILRHEISFSEAVLLLRSPAIGCIENLLHALGLPDLGDDSYKWFLYSIALIGDFHDSLNNSFELHPGFNVNLKKALAISVHLPILLYHLSVRMFFMLRLFSDRDINPWSIRRLHFARYWRFYHFLFSIYRENHKYALKEIADEAFSIASTQHRILEAYDLLKSGDGSEERIRLFKRSRANLEAFKTHHELPWALMGVSSEKFCEDLRSVAAYCKALRESSGSELLYDDAFASDPHVPCDEPQTIQFGPDAFTVPPMTSIGNWRNQWLSKYRKELTSLQNLSTPVSIKTGFVTCDNCIGTIDSLDVKNFFSEVEEHTIKETGNNLKQKAEGLVARLKGLFCFYFELCKHIGKGSELHHAEVNYLELSASYELKVENESIRLAQNYVRLLLLLVLQLVEIANMSNPDASQLVSEVDVPSEEFLIRSDMMIEDMFIAAQTTWATLCAFPTSQEFFVFENVMQLVSNDSLRPSLGNDFPHLRYTDFYHFLYEYGSQLSHCFDPFLVVAAKERGLVIDGSSRNATAKRYFRDAFVRFFFSDLRSTSDEKVSSLQDCQLLFHFEDEVLRLVTASKSLILSLTLSTALNLSQGAANELHGYLDGYNGLTGLEVPHAMSDFQINYISNQLHKLDEGETNIIEIFAGKIRTAMLDEANTEPLLRKNIRHFTSDLLNLQNQIDAFIDLFYELYYPVLNWIHVDLGLPK